MERRQGGAPRYILAAEFPDEARARRAYGRVQARNVIQRHSGQDQPVLAGWLIRSSNLAVIGRERQTITSDEPTSQHTGSQYTSRSRPTSTTAHKPA